MEKTKHKSVEDRVIGKARNANEYELKKELPSSETWLLVTLEPSTVVVVVEE